MNIAVLDRIYSSIDIRYPTSLKIHNGYELIWIAHEMITSNLHGVGDTVENIYSSERINNLLSFYEHIVKLHYQNELNTLMLLCEEILYTQEYDLTTMYLPFILLQNSIKHDVKGCDDSQIYAISVILEKYHLDTVKLLDTNKYKFDEDEKKKLKSFIKYVKTDIEIYKLNNYHILKDSYVKNNKDLKNECINYLKNINLRKVDEYDIYYLLKYYKKYFSSEVSLDTFKINENGSTHFRKFLISLLESNTYDWYCNKFNISSLLYIAIEAYITMYKIDDFIKDLNDIVFNNKYLSLQFLNNYVKILNSVDGDITVPNNAIERRISYVLNDNIFSILSNEEILKYYSS